MKENKSLLTEFISIKIKPKVDYYCTRCHQLSFVPGNSEDVFAGSSLLLSDKEVVNTELACMNQKTGRWGGEGGRVGGQITIIQDVGWLELLQVTVISTVPLLPSLSRIWRQATERKSTETKKKTCLRVLSVIHRHFKLTYKYLRGLVVCGILSCPFLAD